MKGSVMKKLMLFLLLIGFSLVSANQFKLVEFRELASDFKAQREPVSDMDMNYCAVVKLETDSAVVPELKQKVYRKEKLTSGEIYYYVSSTEDHLTFTAPNYEELDIEVEMESGMVYYTKLETIPEVELNLVVEPKPDRIIIADKVYEPGIIKILPGTYPLVLEKEGFKPIQDTLEISLQGANYNYEMVEMAAEPETPAPPPAVETVEVEEETQTEMPEITMYDFSFRVDKVEKLNNTLRIVMTIRNLAEDRELDIHRQHYRPHTKIYDQNGNEYGVDTIKFANKRKNSHITHKLVKNVPTQLELIFRNITGDISKISLFQLGTWTKHDSDFKVEYRDLPVN